MPIETLEQLLKDPRLQAALASEWWSEADTEAILSALERSSLSVRKFAKQTKVGASRLYSRRRAQQLKDAKTQEPVARARDTDVGSTEPGLRAEQPPQPPVPQFVQLTVKPAGAEPKSEPLPLPSPPAPPTQPAPVPPPQASAATQSSATRPLGLKVRFCRSARESPEAVDTFELEVLLPPW
jgi:hypothetical protein